MDSGQDVSGLLQFLIFHKPALPSPLGRLGRGGPCTSKCRSDLAYQMRFGLTSSGHQTAGSPPTSHRAQLGEIYSRQQRWKEICVDPALDIVTRNEEQQRGCFKSLQLADVWESAEKWAAFQTASFTAQIQRTEQAADARLRPTALTSAGVDHPNGDRGTS